MEIFSSDNLIILIKTVGYLGIFGIVFAESGILLGVLLPGDSLLFTAGFLASQNYLNIYFLVFLIFLAAVSGDNFGYYLGHRYGKKVFQREDSRFVKKEHLLKAQEYYKDHGIKTMLLARFIPFVRTLAPLLAGIGKMDYKRFLFFDILGALLWSVSITIMGYFLGNIIPNVDEYILPMIFGIVILSFSPSIIFGLQQYISKIVKKRRSKRISL